MSINIKCVVLALGFVTNFAIAGEAVDQKKLGIPHLDFDRGVYITNLTEDSTHYNLSSEIDVALDHNEDGYSVSTWKSWELGPDFQLEFNDQVANELLATFRPAMGVKPIKIHSINRIRKVQNLEEVDALLKINPYKAADVKKMKEGELVTVVDGKGIIMSGGVNYGFSTVGASYYWSGSFKTEISIQEENKVVVKIHAEEVKSASAYFGINVITISSSLFGQKMNGMNFIYDLSSEAGVAAFEDMMRGSLLLSEKMVANESDTSVLKVSRSSSVSKGSNRMLVIGIPVLANKKWESQKIQNYTETLTLESGLEVKSNNAIVKKASLMKVLGHKHITREETFLSSSYETRINGEKKIGNISKYDLTYENDRADTEKLLEVLNDFGKKTGLKNEINLNLPKNEKLGYTKVSLTVEFSEKQIAELAGLVLSEPEILSNSGKEGVLDYFKKGDRYKYCSEILTSMDRKRRMTKAGKIKNCINRKIKKVVKALSKIQHILLKLRRYAHPKKYSKRMAEIGRELMTSGFVFETVHRHISSKVNMFMKIKGQRFPSFSVDLSTL